MKKYKAKIIIIGCLVVGVVVAGWLTHKHNQKVEASASQSQKTSSQPPGTCAPDLSGCKGNPELCMEENKNAVCN